MKLGTWPHRLLKFFASVKLAVVIILSLAALIAWGTIVESRFDAQAAKKTVYDTAWMYAGMLLLATSLIAVMIDRWPWKKRHTPFLLAHVGILLILFGSVLTLKSGLDGQMTVEIGRSSRFVVLPQETDLMVYASFGGAGMTKLYEETVDFFRHPPTEEKSVSITTDGGEIQIIDYHPYVLPSRKVTATEEKAAGAGLRFQIQNERVNVIDWVVQRRADVPATHDFGPAKLRLGPAPENGGGENEIWFSPKEGGRLEWVLFRKDSDKPAARGDVIEGGIVKTGWMGLELRVLRYLPLAREDWEPQVRPAPTPLTTSAVKVRFQGKEHWLLLNDTLRLFTDSTGYLVSYLNRRIDLGFALQLKSFEMIPYQGTQRAREYQSVVEFPDQGDTLISMNEPAVHNGLTFYQASFQNDPTGKPMASVFSVNHDPGRWWKYMGSLVMSLGIIALFWFRKRFASK